MQASPIPRAPANAGAVPSGKAAGPKASTFGEVLTASQPEDQKRSPREGKRSALAVERPVKEGSDTGPAADAAASPAASVLAVMQMISDLMTTNAQTRVDTGTQQATGKIEGAPAPGKEPVESEVVNPTAGKVALTSTTGEGRGEIRAKGQSAEIAPPKKSGPEPASQTKEPRLQKAADEAGNQAEDNALMEGTVEVVQWKEIVAGARKDLQGNFETNPADEKSNVRGVPAAGMLAATNQLEIGETTRAAGDIEIQQVAGLHVKSPAERADATASAKIAPEAMKAPGPSAAGQISAQATAVSAGPHTARANPAKPEPRQEKAEAEGAIPAAATKDPPQAPETAAQEDRAVRLARRVETRSASVAAIKEAIGPESIRPGEQQPVSRSAEQPIQAEAGTKGEAKLSRAMPETGEHESREGTKTNEALAAPMASARDLSPAENTSGKESARVATPTVEATPVPATNSRAASAHELPPAHQMLDSIPGPSTTTPTPHASAGLSGDAEMRVGIRTAAFGAVEIYTAVHQNQVGLAVHGARDLTQWFSTEVQNLESGLRDHNLNLTTVELHSSGGGLDSGAGSHQQPASQQPASVVRTWKEETADAIRGSKPADAALVAAIESHEQTRVSIRI